MSCIYCAGRSQDATQTLEHIWPQALGGSFAPSIFKTHDVCTRCNSNCGLFVDGAFLKSWFISAERGRSAHDFLDKDRPGPAPFWYMGIDTEFPVREDDLCERWLGLAGEQVYHVHKKDDERWSPYAGGDVIKRKVDPGRVYIFLTSPTEYWSLISLSSLVQQFPKATRRCLTRVDGLPTISVAMPSDQPGSDEERREAEWIANRPKGTHPHKLDLRIDFSDRFLAKLGLGLGHTILGPKVSASPYADELRKMLWSRSPEQRHDIAIRGSGFWKSPAMADVANALRSPGAWSIALTSVGAEGFGMVLTTPAGRFMSLLISDDPSLWDAKSDQTLLNGAAFVFVPQRQRVVGPIPMMELIGHRFGMQPHPDLTQLESTRSDLDQLPPKNTMRPEVNETP